MIPGQRTWLLHATGQGQKNRDQRSSRSGWDSPLNSKFTKTFMENIIHIRDMKLILARRAMTQHDILLLSAAQSLSRVQLFCDPMDYSPLGSLVHGISQQESRWVAISSSFQPTGVGCHFFLQEIFLTQGFNTCLLHWLAGSLPLSHQGSPLTI